MLLKELALVNNSFIKRTDTYNINIGGMHNSVNTATVKDAVGNILKVHIEDKRYLSGELVGVTKGLIKVKDKNNKEFLVDQNDERYLNGDLVGATKGFVPVKDKDGYTFQVSVDDKRYKKGELVHLNKGLLSVRDKDGNLIRIAKGDKRYLNGELKFHWEGKKHKEESKNKISNANKNKQKGEENSQYGTCWIYNENLKQNKKIKRNDLQQWLSQSWLKGRKVY